MEEGTGVVEDGRKRREEGPTTTVGEERENGEPTTTVGGT